jgi:small-conductance mechanosensitive channel
MADFDFNLTRTLEQTIGTNATTSEVLASILLFVGVAVVGWAVYFVFNKYFSKWAAKTETTLDDDILEAVKSIIVVLVILIGIEYALTPLSFLQPFSETLNTVFMIVEILLGAFVVARVINIVTEWWMERTAAPGVNKSHVVFMGKKIIQVATYAAAIFLIVYLIGWDLTGALVGLGIGGIVIGFALQTTLSDFFSALFIYVDRPFEIGDAITMGAYTGTVKNITIRSTRLKLTSGEELIIPNQSFTSQSVHNFRKLEKRRIVFTLGVTYDTSSEKIKKIPLIIRGIIENTENAEVERVHFTEFGDFALKFLVSYYVKVPDYSVYLDTQQSINFAIKDAFEREGIEMAFPTNTVYVKREGAPSKVVPDTGATEAGPLPNFSS